MLRLLLLAVYVFVVTPIGLIAKLVHDPLHRRWNARATTYWVSVPRRT